MDNLQSEVNRLKIENQQKVSKSLAATEVVKHLKTIKISSIVAIVAVFLTFALTIMSTMLGTLVVGCSIGYYAFLLYKSKNEIKRLTDTYKLQ